MEVHHHSLHEQGKKKHFKNYLFEFLLLFLAVTAGFFAENLRERYIERHREKVLMRTLLEDLRTDISQIDSLTVKRKKRNRECDSLIHFLKFSPKGTQTAFIYLFGRRITRRMHFHPQDVALRQLETSGGFRVVHDQVILDGLNSYRLLLILNEENTAVEEKELTEYSGVAAKVFDAGIFQEIIKCDTICMPAGNPLLVSYDPVLLNELCIKLHYWKRTSITISESFETLKKNAEALLWLIKEKYHLKEK